MGSKLENLNPDFRHRINDIIATGDVNQELIQIVKRDLGYILDDLIATKRNSQIIERVKRQLATYDKVSQLPGISEKYPIIREQMVVGIVGALEAFSSDVFRIVANEHPEIITWLDEKEKISFDPRLLQRNAFSIGDAVSWHIKAKYNLQDLKSTYDAYKKYLGIQTEVDEKTKDTLILAAAYRHVVVHNSSIVDEQFIKQVRSTRFSRQFSAGNAVDIQDDFIDNLHIAVLIFVRLILGELYRKLGFDETDLE